jgi:hypothetical protein
MNHVIDPFCCPLCCLQRIAQHLLLPLLRLVLQVLRPFATLIVLSVYYAALLMYPFLYAGGELTVLRHSYSSCPAQSQ